MTRKIKVLGIQLYPKIGDKESNLRKIEYFVKQNSWFKPDLIVLPEVFNSGVGYSHFHALSEFIPDGSTTELMSSLASEHKTNIVAGSYIEKCSDGKFKNSCVVFNRSGNIIGKYHKIHMFSYFGSKESEYITPGNSCAVVETDIGKIGLSICYDLRFPELYRTLTYNGAELIICPAAWSYPRLEHWLILNRARAIENQVYFISVNQTGKSDNSRENLGHSMIIDPWGSVLASSGEEEGVIMAEIDLDIINKTREKFPVLNDRNLEAYENERLK